MGLYENSEYSTEDTNVASDVRNTGENGTKVLLSRKMKKKRKKYSKQLKDHPGERYSEMTSGSRASVKAARKKEAEETAKKAAETRKTAEKFYEKKQTERTTKKLGESLKESVKEAVKSITEMAKRMGEYVASHPAGAFIGLGIALLLFGVMGACGSCGGSIPGSVTTVVGTSYTAEDEDILGANEDYTELEAALQERISNISSEMPGYDEYRFDLTEIGHDPWVLTTILTMKLNAYRRAETHEELQRIFDLQYELTFTPIEETRTRMVERTGTRTEINEEGEEEEVEYTYEEEEEYTWHVLKVTLRNKGLDYVAEHSDFTEDEKGRYDVMLELHGNRPYLFADDIYSNPEADGEGTPGNPITDYELAGSALTDEQFANMWNEAKKYLGKAYVWGGSTPSTGFDCSGYVCWVINKSGAGTIGRTTADGIRQWTDTIPKSERQPGDIVFFQGTYDTPGASHVGIYIGDGKMIHAGDPIKVSNIDSGYFADHFMCYGRIPD